MTPQDILATCNGLRIVEERQNNELFAEVVILANEMSQWNERFSEIFGPPVKPAGAQASENDLYLTKDYGGNLGGILPNQILYKNTFEGRTIFAMFWPWQADAEEEYSKVTLKIVVLLQ